MSEQLSLPLNRYKHWDIYPELPNGWRIDKTAGSPLAGYVFIVDKSPLKGGKRALLKSATPTLFPSTAASVKPSRAIEVSSPHPPEKQDLTQCAIKLNELARLRFEQTLLKELAVDLTICKIEGWDVSVYISHLKKVIDEFFCKILRSVEGQP